MNKNISSIGFFFFRLDVWYYKNCIYMYVCDIEIIYICVYVIVKLSYLKIGILY